MKRVIKHQSRLVGVLLVVAAGSVFAHGDVTPQAIDTAHLPQIGEEWVEVNPYRGNEAAIETGSSAYLQNCARCHGLEAVSGGIAPDLRLLPEEDEGDEWYVMRVRNGAIRDGVTYMPSYEQILTQEALWAIRTYVESRPKDE